MISVSSFGVLVWLTSICGKGQGVSERVFGTGERGVPEVEGILFGGRHGVYVVMWLGVEDGGGGEGGGVNEDEQGERGQPGAPRSSRDRGGGVSL